MPFPGCAREVDGGSQFAASEEACCPRGLEVFVLPPRSPKLNGRVERAQLTPSEEFWDVTPSSLHIGALPQELLPWE
jgi:putative transposase